MEYAEKHYVIPQNQMNKLRAGNPRETIQEVVENNLDVAIRNILQRSDLDSYGKAKLYSSVLQRFLTIVKQGDLASDTLTLTLPKPDGDGSGTTVNEPTPASNNVVDVQDEIVDEILHNVPQRSLKNVKFILNKMSNAKHLSTWTNTGEFVFKGRVINGSHMLDLVKSITAPHTIRDEYRPRGWSEFLDAFAVLNIPFSTVTNPQVKRSIEGLKGKSITQTHQMSPEIPTPLKKRRGKRVVATSHLITPVGNAFNSPTLDANAWLSF